MAALRSEVRNARAALSGGGRKKNGARRRGRPQQQSETYTRPYRQGMAAVPTTAFNGGSRIPRGPSLMSVFDATKTCHLPLPRAIGPYAVVRTTTLHRSSAPVVILGPMQSADTTAQERPVWSSFVGVECVNPGAAMNAPNNTVPIPMMALADTSGAIQSGWSNCELVPAAYTVQIMYPSPVGTAGGVARIGKLKTKSHLKDNARTWNAFADQFTSYNAPRLCAGGKLCLRGVQASATPYDMADLADFTPLRAVESIPFTWTTNRAQEFAGFAPIVIVNDLSTADPPLLGGLEYLITVEWRVRFDPSNPAQAAHVLRPPSTESMWAKAVAGVEAAGHGVFDIAERVAEFGARHPALVRGAGEAIGLL